MPSNCSLKSCSHSDSAATENRCKETPTTSEHLPLLLVRRTTSASWGMRELLPAQLLILTPPSSWCSAPHSSVWSTTSNLKSLQKKKKKKPHKQLDKDLRQTMWALQFRTAHWKAAWMINLSSSLTVTYFTATNFRAVRTAGKSCYVAVLGYTHQRSFPPLPCLKTCSCRYYNTYPSGTGTCFVDFGCGQRRGWGWPPHSECCEGRAPGEWWLQA